MKVVGKMGNKFMVSMDRDELINICFGEVNDSSNSVVQQRERALFSVLDNSGSAEVRVGEAWRRTIGLYHTKLSGGYSTVSARLDAIKGLITPIEDFIKSLDNTEENG